MRLIDADALPVKFWFGRFFGVAEIDIVNAPTVDAAEVVRCKDCRYCSNDEMFDEMWCNGKRVSADWFCADGERRKEVEYAKG